MSRNAMKSSLALAIMALLMLGYSNCSKPKFNDSGANPFGSTGSPSDSGLVISPANKNVAWSETVQLNTSGGTPPYFYRLVSGGGSIDQYSGLYKSEPVNGTAVIEVQDTAGLIMQTNVFVNFDSSSSLTLSYASPIALNSQVKLAAAGGKAPYTYFMVSGVGSISSDIFYGKSFGTGVVGVRDADGKTATFSLVVGSTPPVVTKQIYRLYHSKGKQYLYSLSKTEGTSSGFALEGAAFKVLEGSLLSTVELLRCYMPANGARFLAAASCGAFTNEGRLGYVYTYNPGNALPLYTCFKAATGTYLNTTDYSVCVNNGFNVEATKIGFVPQ